MKAKTFKIIIPTIISLLIVAGLLILEDYFHAPEPYSDTPVPLDFVFYLFLLIPIIFIAGAFQAFVTIPLWTKFKSKPKLFGLRLWQIAGLFSLLAGTVLGLLFFSRKLGVQDFIQMSLIGAIIFFIYWTLNFLTLYLIDKTK